MNSNNSTAIQQSNESSIDTSEVKEKNRCSNCGTSLSGQFCHNCGQSSKSMIKFFGEVIRELFDDALGYDSRLKHSILPLLFKPGKLTADYVSGKRFYYVLPFRLYLITSLIFLIVIKNTTEIHADSTIKQQDTIAAIDKELAREISEDDDFSIDVTLGADDENEEPKKHSDEPVKADRFSYSWDPKTETWKNIDLLEEGFEKDFLQNIGPKIAGWKTNPTPLIKKFIELLPYMMFVILPIFGIVLKGFYLFSKRYYTEHLIFLLHNHSFLYIAFLLQTSIAVIDALLTPTSYWLPAAISSILSLITFLLYVWMMLYIVLAIKRFYQQGWAMTLLKTTLLSSIYIVLLSIGFLVTLFVGAYQV